MSETKPDIREAVGVFQSAEALEAAIEDLQSNGFDRAEISLLGADKALETKLGHRYARVKSEEDDVNAPRTAWISTESTGDAEGALMGGLMYIGATAAMAAVFATGGAAAAALAAGLAGGGAGGLIGSVFASIVGNNRAKAIEEQLEAGGLLLWVRTWTPEDEAKATDILKRHGAEDVHVHSFPPND